MSSTYMATKDSISRKWYILDAAGRPLGRTATIAATLLRGKLKTEYTPHVDCGDYVIVINCDKAVLTGKKGEQKYYYRPSRRLGNTKQTKYRILMENQPEVAMRAAVKRMLPDNALSDKQMTRLRLYTQYNDEHIAQNPVPYTAE